MYLAGKDGLFCFHGDEGTLDFHDTNFAGRPGWQEVVADGADGALVSVSTVPRTDRSQALRAYPQDLLESPPQVTVARFHVARGTGPVGGRQQPTTASVRERPASPIG